KQQDHDKHLRAGKAILEKEKHKLQTRDVDLDALARHFNLPRPDDVLLAIGRGDSGPGQLAAALQVPGFPPPPVPPR
ncbi:GTP diphosphokinase, partial [Methylococcus sp. S1M]